MRLIVADDSLLLREGISRLLVEAGFEVVGLASTGEEALAQVRATQARRRDRRHPDAADTRRRAEGGSGDPGPPSRRRGAGAVAVRRAGLAARLLAENAAGLGYLLKDRITDLDEFAAAFAASARRVRPRSRHRLPTAGEAPRRRPA